MLEFQKIGGCSMWGGNLPGAWVGTTCCHSASMCFPLGFWLRFWFFCGAPWRCWAVVSEGACCLRLWGCPRFSLAPAAALAGLAGLGLRFVFGVCARHRILSLYYPPTAYAHNARADSHFPSRNIACLCSSQHESVSRTRAAPASSYNRIIAGGSSVKRNLLE